MPLCANVLHADGGTGSRGGGDLTALQKALLGIAQKAASAQFSVGGTSSTPEKPFGSIIANSLLTLLRVTSAEGNVLHVLQAKTLLFKVFQGFQPFLGGRGGSHLDWQWGPDFAAPDLRLLSSGTSSEAESHPG